MFRMRNTEARYSNIKYKGLLQPNQNPTPTKSKPKSYSNRIKNKVLCPSNFVIGDVLELGQYIFKLKLSPL